VKIEAKTLDEAYSKAAEYLNCSVTEIDAKIVQNPSKGIFGLFCKNAIIEVEDYINIDKLIKIIKEELITLFNKSCFNLEISEVSKYNEETVFIKIDGEDAALLIGKEGYRYKALSYMIFNWINSKYDVQLRLEIAEFLKNQEESISRYLEGVYESIDRDGRAQTKILDGVLVQIALKELRERYPQKYVVIRSTKDGLKYIIVNDYHNN